MIANDHAVDGKDISALPYVSRRALVGAIAVTPLAVSPAFAGGNFAAQRMGDDTMNMHSSFAPRKSTDRTWDRLVCAHADAERNLDRFYESIFNPAVDRVAERVGKSPGLQFVVPTKKGGNWDIWMKHEDMDEYAESFIYGRWARPVRDAYVAWKRHLDQVEAEEGMPGIRAREDKLLDALNAAEQALMTTPAPHFEALARKIAITIGAGNALTDEWEAIVADDARRLLDTRH